MPNIERLESTLTRGGRTTLPKKVLEELNLREGDRIRYVIEGEGVSFFPLKPLLRLAGSLRYHGNPKTLEEMERGIISGATDASNI